MRDRLAQWICNFVLNVVATREYRDKIDCLIKQGLVHAELNGPLIKRRDSSASSD